ncbi:MAG: HAMP domain-containing protein [Proteobacteria bacterium]|nr:HAMP domain-containing protein [Cystobacterineae bacterium]MCL2259608.1 HAMP domain-containing protein [Cystobacterineae bacterium]MCL2314875.1 HAMP domain-containing protein [Pseudomonadota bacterium]
MSFLSKLIQTLFPRLFHRLVALIFLITLPLALGLAWVNTTGFWDRVKPYVFRLDSSLSEHAASEVIHHLEQAQSQLTAMGIALLEGGEVSDEERLNLVGNVLSESKLLDFIAVYGPEMKRRLVAKALGSKDPVVLPENLPEFRFIENKAERLGTGNIVAGGDGPMLEIVLRVFDSTEKQTRAWLYSQINLSIFCKLTADLQEKLPFQPSSVFIIDKEGHLLAHPNAQLLGPQKHFSPGNLFEALGGVASIANYKGVAEFEEKGVEMMGAILPITELGWGVVITHPSEDAFRDLKSALVWTLYSIVACLVLALASGIFLAKRISKPLQSLTLATQLLAKRQFEQVEPALCARSDEFGQLAQSFERMFLELKAYECKLIQETQVRAALSRYLPADIVENLIQNPQALKLGGERRFVTVLFCDIIGFTYISEAFPPETIVSLLNELFSIATEIIHKRKGIIDKFIGDCIMAVWGVPESHPDDAEMALLAAEDLRRWLEVGNRRWRQKWGVEIQLAMGMHSGMAVAGNIGSEKRMDYTVIGDTVNIAARLEDSAQAGQILVSDTTRSLIREDTSPAFKCVGDKTLRGKSTTTLVYEVLE